MDLFPELQCRREFLGWDAPLLPKVVQYFLDLGSRDGGLDLGGWICVTPTTQSALRLAQLIKTAAIDSNLEFIAPDVVTAGDIAETLYQPEKPIAIEFEQTLAWARLLRSRPPESLRPLLPVLPESESLTPWLELAGTLRRLSTDLASHEVTFADVLKIADTEGERQRWELLDQLFDLYLNELNSAGLTDPHVQRGRAIRRRSLRSQKKIALIGTSDLNESVAKVIAGVDQDVVALIAAPADKESYFDWLGRLKTEAFAEFELPIADRQLIPATDIADQASAVVESIIKLESEYEHSQITVGVTDDSQLAATEMELEGCGYSPYRHVGWTVAATAPGKLIEQAANLISRPTWRSLAALVRHGDMHRYLQNKIAESNPDVEVDLLVQLDELLANHLPVRLSAPLPQIANQRYPIAIAIRQAVFDWLSPLIGDRARTAPGGSATPFGKDTFSRTQPIADWCVCLLQWIDSIYAGIDATEDSTIDRSRTVQAVQKIRDLLTRFAKLSRQLDVRVSAAGALETLAGRFAELRVGQTQGDNDVQIHGWLDLPLDDSPAMIIVGLNHPFVPSAVTSDPFLPGSLRKRLRLADNERRYARDVYAMQLILSTRKDVRLIVGKNSADGSPTPPSRLLAAASPTDLARRVRLLLGGHRDRIDTAHHWNGDLKHSELPIPTVTNSECPVSTMSVTAFKAYLDCPFRFYLRHVLKLKPIDDSASELAANQFGDLVHGAVEHFGESTAKDESDEKHIFAALQHHLHEYAAAHFGKHVESAVSLQIRQAERRLRFVAAEQAKRIELGWRIHATEAAVAESKGAGVTVDGKRMGLRGRFDRIDHNQHTGQWAILDYKTHGHKPEKKHLRTNRETGEKEWIDLQLPLYRMMIPFLGIDADPQDVQLGYFNVSDKAEETKINIAEFSEPLMKQAEALIHQCVRRIFACDFAPTDQRVMYDDYEMILQTGVASRMLASASISEEGNDA